MNPERTTLADSSRTIQKGQTMSGLFRGTPTAHHLFLFGEVILIQLMGIHLK